MKRYACGRQLNLLRRLCKHRGAVTGMAIILCIVVISILSGFFFDYDSDIIAVRISQRLIPPCPAHWFGTDDLGRDVFKCLLYGSRFTLSIACAATMLSLLIGGFLGVLSGYFSGLPGEVILRFNDILSAIPAILLGIAIAASLGPSIRNLILAIGLSGIPAFVRISRAAVFTVRNQDFVKALRTVGLKDRRILFLHILPNCLSPIIVQTSLRIASSIIAVSSLSFLGLGVPVPAPEWGNMLNQGRQYIRVAAHMTVFPGLAILVTVLAFNLLGDGLRDAFDPKIQKR